MLKEVILVSVGGFSEIFASWEKIGIFSYLLPFLLIFALVFGILTTMKLFKENKGINIVIALAVSLIALQYPLVPQFFSLIIPKIGIGLIILLAALILLGLFADPESNVMNYVLLGVGGLVFLSVLITTAKSVGLPYGEWFASNWTTVIGILVILVFIIIVVSSTKPQKPKWTEPPPYRGFWARQ